MPYYTILCSITHKYDRFRPVSLVKPFAQSDIVGSSLSPRRSICMRAEIKTIEIFKIRSIKAFAYRDAYREMLEPPAFKHFH